MREVRLAAPLAIVDAPLQQPGPGQVLIRNRHLALRAAMGLLMTGRDDLPMPAYRHGEVMWGPAVGEVVAGDLPPGTLVAHHLGWREYALLDATAVTPISGDPLAHLAQAETAYVGLVAAAELREGDTVLVSSAAGSIGTMAGQIARLKGAKRVIGSVGSPAKAAWLVDELGFDAAYDYHEEAVEEGIDVYFDSVGGTQLATAVEVANPGARFALCGALSGQTVALDTMTVIGRRISLRGFTAADHPGVVARAREEIVAWRREGLLAVPVTRYDGLDQAPGALADLLAGRLTGTVIVDL
ncbi:MULTISPECIES: zinc-binding dehydrogenase [Nonomuraea]|uniref:Zinc-binding dehydrogenase n=1 Tax=Nonomuraea mangrovi TaxID=2316207 RepID=A0ABW4T645_9ACTN